MMEEDQVVEFLRQATQDVHWEEEDEHGDLSEQDQDKKGGEQTDDPEVDAGQKEVGQVVRGPDEIIKRTCVRVALASFASAGYGFGALVAFTLGMAATTGIVMKLQSDMIDEIARFYGQELSLEARQRTLLVLSGVNQSTANASAEIAKALSSQAVSLVSARVATQSNVLLAAIPIIGPLTAASMAATATYALGQRAKVLFSSGEEALSSWSESVRTLSGLDERRLAKWLAEAWQIVKRNAGDKVRKGKVTVLGAIGSVKSSVTKRLSFRRPS